MSRALGLVGVVAGALWIMWAVFADDRPLLLVPVLAGFLASLWAVYGRFATAIGPVGTAAFGAGALGVAVMVVGALADADAILVAGGIVTLVALVVAGVIGARRLEGAPQWLLALAAGAFSAIPLWEVSFGLGFGLLGAAVAWPAPETLELREEAA